MVAGFTLDLISTTSNDTAQAQGLLAQRGMVGH